MPKDKKTSGFKVSALTDDQDPMRVMWYGDVGSGKTNNAARMATLGKVFFIDKESGVKSRALKRLDPEFPIQNIGRIRAEDYDSVEEVYWKLRNDSEGKIKGVVIDSSTDLQAATLQEVTEGKAASNSNRDPFHATMDDRQRVNEMVRRIIRRFRELEINMGVTALLRQDDYEDDDGEVHNRYGPALTPGIQGDIMGYMDIVVYCRTMEFGEDIEYQGLFKATPRWVAKDRYGLLPKMLINPTFDRILAYVEGGLTVATDPVMQEGRERRQAMRKEQETKEKKKSAKKGGKKDG